MNAGLAALVDYSRALEDIIRPLTPLLVYFYQEDVEQAIRTVSASVAPSG